MKKKKTEPKYATYGQLVDELAKFNLTDRACIIASTDLSDPESGENFVDGSGVRSVNVVHGTVKITCGDSGTMTWGQLLDALKDKITLGMVDKAAIIQIGYPGMVDFEEYECELRHVKNCSVDAENDTIWNIELGETL